MTNPRSRGDARSNLMVAAKYRQVGNKSFIDGLCTNLSSAGAFVGTNRPLPVRSVVVVELNDDADNHPGALQCSAQVVWTRAATRGENCPTGMGLRFLNLGTHAREKIEELVKFGDFGSSGTDARRSNMAETGGFDPVTLGVLVTKPYPQNVNPAPKSTASSSDAAASNPAAAREVLTDAKFESAVPQFDVATHFARTNAQPALTAVVPPSDENTWRAMRLVELVRDSHSSSYVAQTSAASTRIQVRLSALDEKQGEMRPRRGERNGGLKRLLARMLRD